MEVALLQKTFQRKLQQAMDANDWNQSDLARAMGVPPQYVSKYLRGESSPGLDVIERFAKALQIPAIMLLDDSEILHPIS